MMTLTYLGGSWSYSKQAGVMYRDTDESPDYIYDYVASLKEIRTHYLNNEIVS